MRLIKGNVMKIVLINTALICLSQFLFFPLQDFYIFQIIFTILILLPVNIIIWFSKIKIEFWDHWISIYVGFFCATAVFYAVNTLFVDEANDFPPGEAYFDLFLTVFIYGFLQFLILLLLNGATYIIFKYTYKKLT